MKLLKYLKASASLLSGALLLSSLALNAQAATLVPAESFIHFTCQIMGGPTRGQFNRFSGRIDLDPAHPTQGHTLIQVDPASIEVSSSDAEEEARGKNWFDVAHFPEMRFESQSIQSAGGQHYQVKGRMTVAGMAMDMTVPVDLLITPKNEVAKGRFTLKRSWFRLGKGEWAAFDTVGDDVTVDFQFTLKR
jgi:polyisoprenoid-binding protein YceI